MITGKRKPFSSRPLLALLALATLLVQPIAVSTQADAQGVPKRSFGDWQERCDEAPGAPKTPCALVQNVTAEDQENVALSVIALKTQDGQARVLRVLAPLGVLLTSGLGLKVDGQEIGNAPFVRCLANGCFAEVVMNNDLITKLETGKQATFIIFQTPEEGIGIPISLNGFKEGFAALQ